ncbi:MAG: DUF4079 family protein [Nitrospirae bacterium]|nr:DUF4079 family protein [Nitrospirota bacterium]
MTKEMSDIHSYSPIINLLGYIHGTYNFFVFIAFIYQSIIGLRIRKERLQGNPPNIHTIRKHRKSGPIFAVEGVIGFLAGMTIVYIAEGHIMVYPLHFFIGLLITLSIIITLILSKKIKSRESKWRTLHLASGILIICLYVIQIFIGIKIIFT